VVAEMFAEIVKREKRKLSAGDAKLKPSAWSDEAVHAK
jgi:hypothetical protein